MTRAIKAGAGPAGARRALKNRNRSHDFPRRVRPFGRPDGGDWALPRPHLELREIATCAWSLLGRRVGRTSALVAAARSRRRPGQCGTLADDRVDWSSDR